MSRIPNYPYSIDDNDSVFSSSENLNHGVHVRHSTPSGTTKTTTGYQPTRLSGEWSTRLSSSSNGRDSLPPTRAGQLKPGDASLTKVDPLRLVKAEANPLVNHALETMSVLEQQKQAQKESKKTTSTTTTTVLESSDVAWEENLSSWKDRRKSKPTYQPKALELEEDQTETSVVGGKRSKTFKELMEEKEKRADGHGMFTYENEDSPSINAVTTTTTTSSKTRTLTTGIDVPSKMPDPVPNSSAMSSKSHDSNFYFTSSLADGLGSEAEFEERASRSTKSHKPEIGTVLVQQKSSEINLEFQTPTAISAPETKVLIQKAAAVESVRSTDTDSDSERKPWQSTVRQKPEVPPSSTTSTSGVRLREKTASSTQQTRPYSYAFTSTTGYNDSRSARTEPLKPQPRSYLSSQVTTQSIRGSTTEKPTPNRSLNSPLEGLSKDRQFKSNWELNLTRSHSGEKSDHPEFKVQQKSGVSSSAKFQQALSLFQSKEVEVGQPPPTKAPLTTQRSVGKISRVPVEENPTKPVRAPYVSAETRRGITTTNTAYKPSAESRSGYQTEATRIREFSRSAHGLEQYRPESDIRDRKTTGYTPYLRSEEKEDRYGLRKSETKKETSNPSSIEYDSSSRGSLVNVHSSDDEKEKFMSADVGKPTNSVAIGENTLPSRVELDFSIPKTSLETNKHDNQNEKIGVGSTVSWTLKLEKDPSTSRNQVDISCDKQSPSEAATRSISSVHSVTSRESPLSYFPETRLRDREEEKFRASKYDDVAVPDWRMDQRRESLTKAHTSDSNEPKSLYAFKYQTTNTEESVVAGRDKEHTKATNFKTTYTEKFSDEKTSPTQLETVTAKSTALPGLRDSYTRDAYKVGDAASTRRAGADEDLSKARAKELPNTSVPEISYSDRDSDKSTQQPSISDIFRKRSAAAVRGKSFSNELDSPLPYTASTSLDRTRLELGDRSENESARHQEAEVDDKESYKERKNGEISTKSITRSHISDVAGLHGNEPRQNADDSSAAETIRGAGRSYGDFGGSSRRQYGLERTNYAPDKDKTSTRLEKLETQTTASHEPIKQEKQHYDLRRQSDFEVNFSSSALEKKSPTELIKIETDKDKSGIKMDEPVFEGRFDDSFVVKPLEMEVKRIHETTKQSHEVFLQPGTDDQPLFRKHALKTEVVPVGDGGAFQSHHDDYYVGTNAKASVPDMNLSELSSSSMFRVNDKDTINLNRNLNNVLNLDFFAAEPEHRPEAKSELREEDSKDGVSFLSDKTRISASPTPESPLHKPRPPSPDVPPPSPIRKSPLERKASSVPRSPSPPKPSSSPPPLIAPDERPSMFFDPLPSLEVSASPVAVDRLSSLELRPTETVRFTEDDKLIDFNSKADDRTSFTESRGRDSSAEERLRKSETNDDYDKTVEGTSNISFDLKLHPMMTTTTIPQQQLPESSTVSLSFDQKAQETPVTPTPREKHPANGVADTRHEASQRGGEILGATISKIERKESSPPKKQPPEVPNKPKPNVQKGGDDFSFLSNTRLLDTSANRDKCRLIQEGPKRRPKSICVPSVETIDPSTFPDGTQPSFQFNGINGIQGNAVDARDGADDLGISTRKTEELTSLRMKASLKGTRPLSYSGELNSSLAKRFKENANPIGGKDENVAATELTAPGRSQNSSNRGSEAVDFGDASDERVRPKGGIKIPGLMDELNFSLTKKFQENPQESSENQMTSTHSVLQKVDDHAVKLSSVDVSTTKLGNDDDDDEDGGAPPPPPLPDVPPPLPNWNSFPGDSPGLPPSGPPPPLIDLNFSEEEDSGNIQFRMDASGSRQPTELGQNWWKEEESGKTSKSDEMDFSFA